MKTRIIVLALVSLIFAVIIWLRINIFISPDIDYARQTEWMYEKGWQSNEGLLLFDENDVWAYQIYITKYVINGSSFSMELKFVYWDHFGLDCSDIMKFNKDIFYS